MQQHLPEFRQARSQAGMTWTGQLTPTPLSETYTIELIYRRHHFPEVWIREPLLRTSREDYKVIHIYSEGCLCLHSLEEWKPWMTLSSTFIPWSAEWLLYYELWLTTGNWYGGGEYRVGKKMVA
jgi:hypothetical protein